MKSWKFTEVKDGKIRIDDWVREVMGLVEGGYIYSTLFKHPEAGPKQYELLLSMYPQENFRTMCQINMYMEDVPGSTVQSAVFLADQGINIFNSVSLNGISDTTIIWSMSCELNFAGEAEIIKERFAALKEANDPSVDKIKYISIKPAKVGRIFRKESDSGTVKEEIKHGTPVTFSNGYFDLAPEYGDILKDWEGSKVLLTLDVSSWLVSVVFFKPDTKLIEAEMSIPDCPGSIGKALEFLAENDINLISVFSKIKIAYQIMSLEIVADMKHSKVSLEQLKAQLAERYENEKGIFTLDEITVYR